MQPCVSQGGLLILRIEAHGRTAHAARAHLGENAIYKAMRDLQRLETYEFDRSDPYLGPPTLTPTVIEAGKARNVVPDLCTFYLDIRTNASYAHDELIDLMGDLMDSDVHVHSKRLIPVATDPSERIVQACLHSRPDAQPFGSPTVSDWIFLHDVPTVKIGPGRSERSHRPDEHIALQDVEDATAIYQAIIRAYFDA
jgi:acetylornithine deacetylase